MWTVLRGANPFPTINADRYKTYSTISKGKSVEDTMLVDWDRLREEIKPMQDQLGREFIAFYSQYDPDSEQYTYSPHGLIFSDEAVVQADGKSSLILFEVTNPVNKHLNKVILINAPVSELANEEMRIWTHGSGNSSPQQNTRTSFMSKAVSGSSEPDCGDNAVYNEGIGCIYEVEGEDVIVTPEEDWMDDPFYDHESSLSEEGDGGGGYPPQPTDPDCDVAYSCGSGGGGDGNGDGDGDGNPEDCMGVDGGLAYVDSCGNCVGGTSGLQSCCASFDAIMVTVFNSEGGYSDREADKGGKTNKGISWRIWQHHAQTTLGISPTVSNLQALTDEQAKMIYYSEFWQRSRVANFLDGDLARMFFDFYINTNVGATESIQKALFYLGYAVNIDGAMGPETEGFINMAIMDGNLITLHNSFKDEMKNYYHTKANDERFPKQKENENGWINRVNKFEDKTEEEPYNLHCDA